MRSEPTSYAELLNWFMNNFDSQIKKAKPRMRWHPVWEAGIDPHTNTCNTIDKEEMVEITISEYDLIAIMRRLAADDTESHLRSCNSDLNEAYQSYLTLLYLIKSMR